MRGTAPGLWKLNGTQLTQFVGDRLHLLALHCFTVALPIVLRLFKQPGFFRSLQLYSRWILKREIEKLFIAVIVQPLGQSLTQFAGNLVGTSNRAGFREIGALFILANFNFLLAGITRCTGLGD